MEQKIAEEVGSEHEEEEEEKESGGTSGAKKDVNVELDEDYDGDEG